MQVDPLQFVLKAPGTVRLKLHHDKLLSTCAFKFKLRRYSEGKVEIIDLENVDGQVTQAMLERLFNTMLVEAGDGGRGLH